MVAKLCLCEGRDTRKNAMLMPGLRTMSILEDTESESRSTTTLEITSPCYVDVEKQKR